MNDHEHDYFRTLGGALKYACGKSNRISAPALSAAEAAIVAAFALDVPEPSDAELVQMARLWPAADEQDRAIILDLADALDRHVSRSASDLPSSTSNDTNASN